MDVAKAAGLKMVGVGGVDIVDGKKKLVLALLFQMIRKNCLDILGGATEEKILEWANGRVSNKLSSFKDA